MNEDWKVVLKKLFFNTVVNILLVGFIVGTYWLYFNNKLNTNEQYKKWFFLAILYGTFSLLMNIALYINNYIGGNEINIMYYNFLYFSFIIILIIIDIIKNYEITEPTIEPEA